MRKKNAREHRNMNQMNLRIQFEIVCSCLWLSDCGFSSHAIFSLRPQSLLLLLSCAIRRLFVAAHRFSVYWKTAQNWQQTHTCKSTEWKCFNYTWNRTHTSFQRTFSKSALCSMLRWLLFIVFLPIWHACNSFPREIQHTKSFRN